MEKKIDRRKNYIMVLDTETAGEVENPIAYDIGFIIADTKGNIYEKKSFMVREMFYKFNGMSSAYYAEKLPMYWHEYFYNERNRMMKSMYEIKTEIKRLVDLYEVTECYAYNASFDRKSLNNLQRYWTDKKWFLPYGISMNCIWFIACQTLLQQKRFKKMAKDNEWLTPCGNYRTSAEISYRYITKNTGFLEEHTALEDSEIEYAILIKCLSLHKHFEKGIKYFPWRLVQDK
jgi:hypothetical protein